MNINHVELERTVAALSRRNQEGMFSEIFTANLLLTALCNRTLQVKLPIFNVGKWGYLECMETNRRCLVFTL
jgi:hypothetical protein